MVGRRSQEQRAQAASGKPLGESLPNQPTLPEAEPEKLVRELQAINEQLVVTSAQQTELAKQARQQAALREDYVALISHDLRGPLTNILGRADLLAASISHSANRLDQDRKNIEAIQKSARQMKAMIQDLVDTVRLESGNIVLRPTPIDIVAIIRDVVDGMFSSEEQTRTRVEVGDNLPAVLADRDRIQRVVSNLLGNALKYSPTSDPVVVQVAAVQDGVVISVTDHGIGISPEDRAHLFEKYYRTKASRSTDGLGLGLYIARMIVEATGGRIWVESEPGKGSTFSFSLPAAAQEKGMSP
jgi:signal transduction histidine kinase